MLLQDPVVALPLEAVLGEVLRTQVAVLGGSEVVSSHGQHPFVADVRSAQRELVK